MSEGILELVDVKDKIRTVAALYRIKEISLFGSYFDGNATGDSDIDIIVSYGENCKGLKCLGFMQDLEKALGKKVDVISREFPPRFLTPEVLNDKRRIIYSESGS